jgi:hypothetical protein
MLSAIILIVMPSNWESVQTMKAFRQFRWRHDTQHNDIQDNDTVQNTKKCDTQHNDIP